MKRLTLGVAMLALVASIAVVFGSGVAAADPGNGNGALVVNGTGCGIFDGDGNYSVFTTDTHSVVNGNQTLVTCKAKGVANSTGHAVTYDDQNNPFGPGTYYTCWNGTYPGTWHETITPSGNATTIVNCPGVA
jgi:hypothetical protein